MWQQLDAAKNIRRVLSRWSTRWRWQQVTIPIPTQSLGIRLPVTFDTCEVIEDRCANWMRQDQVVVVEAQADNLRSASPADSPPVGEAHPSPVRSQIAAQKTRDSLIKRILALHLFDPDLRFLLPGASPPIDRVRGTDRNTGRPVEAVLETDTLDHVNQIRRELWRYRAFAPDGTIAEEEMLELAIRWTFRWEMRHLLRLAGFIVEAEFSDFVGSPPAYGKEQIWAAHKS